MSSCLTPVPQSNADRTPRSSRTRTRNAPEPSSKLSYDTEGRRLTSKNFGICDPSSGQLNRPSYHARLPMDRLARNLDDLRAIVRQLTDEKVPVRFVKENLTFTGEDTVWRSSPESAREVSLSDR